MKVQSRYGSGVWHFVKSTQNTGIQTLFTVECGLVFNKLDVKTDTTETTCKRCLKKKGDK